MKCDIALAPLVLRAYSAGRSCSPLLARSAWYRLWWVMEYGMPYPGQGFPVLYWSLFGMSFAKHGEIPAPPCSDGDPQRS